MKAGNFWAVILLLSFIAVSCKQDSIFFTIASETAPLRPRIEGSPTNMVVFYRNNVPIMYAASGRLHWYATAPGADWPQWDLKEYAIPQPGGKVSALAVAGNRLYALCRSGYGISSTLRYIESNGNTWETIRSESTTYPVVQSIFADPESTRLFAGAGKNDQSQATYGILYLDNDTLKPLMNNTSILSGAVYHGAENTYYLSTRGNGIFQISEADLAENNIDAVQPLDVAGNSSRMFMSMMKLNDDTIIAVERDGGAIYRVQGGSSAQMQYTTNYELINIGRYATGAHALWKDPERDLTLFINGIQGGLYYTTTISQTYGYVEFELDAEGNSFTTRYDRGSLLSVHDNDRYTASIGKHPINHLFQAPDIIDPNMTFFASTQTEGLWSYRNRPSNGGWQWNAEE